MTTRRILCGLTLGLGLLAAAGCGESQPPATGGTTAEAAGEETPDVAGAPPAEGAAEESEEESE
jgi:hypothetical protein